MAGLNDWSKTAADNATKGDINFAEGQRPSSLNDSNRVAMADTAKQRDDISGAVETTGAAGVYAMTPNATATNQTTGLMVRVQINHDSPSGGCTFNYGSKGAKAIKIIDSAGERDPNANELKQNAFCTMTYDADANSSAGAWIATDIVTAALDTSNFSLRVEAEGTKPSAATCDIGSVTEYRVKVTGTTAITSFGSVVNSRKLVRFTAALTLTHHATSLILPGGANITTAAGDVAEFASDGSGNWRCVGMVLASGRALVSDSLLDEDDFASDSDTQAATQQSIKAYVDGKAKLSKSYDSGDQTITAGGSLSLAHGLSEAPKIAVAYLKCTTAELGYSVGDIIPWVDSGHYDNRGVSIEISGTTNIVCQFGDASSTFWVLNTSGALSGITNSSWKLIVRAYA